MGFEKFEPIFGQVKAEWSAVRHTAHPHPFLFFIHALPNDPSTLRVHVSDFHLNTFEALKSVQDLEDMRDAIGIGGSWSEFIDYVTSSFSSQNVNLVLEGESRSGGASRAKLVAQRVKGMPRVSISLKKLEDAAAAGEAMANISLEVYRAFKNVGQLLVIERERCCQLREAVSSSSEQGKDATTVSRQLDAEPFSRRHKSSHKTTDQAGMDATSVVDPPPATQKHSTRAPNRPVSRRAKLRGALLRDTEDEEPN